MRAIEKKIKLFASNEENILEAQAILVVGRKKGDSSEEAFKRMIAAILLKFHGIPYEDQKGMN